jgi:hypothetical protein
MGRKSLGATRGSRNQAQAAIYISEATVPPPGSRPKKKSDPWADFSSSPSGFYYDL